MDLAVSGTNVVPSSISILEFSMLEKLQENVDHSNGPGRTSALAALRLCRVMWQEYRANTIRIASGSGNAVVTASLQSAPEELFDTVSKINLSLRAQLKTAGDIARNIYRILLGPLDVTLSADWTGRSGSPAASGPLSTTSAGPLVNQRTFDNIFPLLEQGVLQLRREMFSLQHGSDASLSSSSAHTTAPDETEAFNEMDFSIRDFLQLADFKMSHAAKRIFEVETNAANKENDGFGIDWEFRVHEMTRDLRGQLSRTIHHAEVERAAANEAIRRMHEERDKMIEQLSTKHAAEIEQHQREADKMRNAFNRDLSDLSSELSRRLHDLQLSFLHKLSELRDVDAESKAACIRALQACLALERSRIEEKYNSIGTAEDSIQRENLRYIGDLLVADEPVEVHEPWEGESKETLIRLLRGSKEDMELQQQQFHSQMRLKTLEFESQVRELVNQYTVEFERMKDRVKHCESEVEHANKLAAMRTQDAVEAKAEAQRVQRDSFDEVFRVRQEAELSVNKVTAEMEASAKKLSETVDKYQTLLRQHAEQREARVSAEQQVLHQVNEVRRLQEELQQSKPVVETADAECQTGKYGGASSRMSMDSSQLADGSPGFNGSTSAAFSKQQSTALDPSAAGSGGKPTSANATSVPAHGRRAPGSGRGAAMSLDALEAAAGEGANAAGGGDDAPPPSKPLDRRKSKFSEWYDEQKKIKERERDGVKEITVDVHKGGSNESAGGALSPPKAHDWISNTLDEDLFARLMHQDEGDAMVMARNQNDTLLFLGGADPRASDAAALGPSAPSTAPAGASRQRRNRVQMLNVPVVANLNDVLPRLLQENNFYRVICKLAAYVEFSTAMSSYRHAQSPLIKKLNMLLHPSHTAALRATTVRNAVALDLVTVSHYVQAIWGRKLEKLKHLLTAPESHVALKDAFQQSATVTQSLRNLNLPTTLDPVPVSVVTQYLAEESAGDSSHPRARKDQSDLSPFLRVVPLAEVKLVVHAVGQLLSFMKSNGAILDAAESTPLVGEGPHNSGGSSTSPDGEGGLQGEDAVRGLTVMTPASRTATPSSFLYKRKGSERFREAIMIVSNVKFKPRAPQ